MERLTRDIGRLCAGQINRRRADVLARAEPPERHRGQDRFALLVVQSASVIGLAMKPGAMQLTVMPREATSAASAFDMPIRPALAAA